MMTIQRQNPESIELSLKIKLIIISIVLIGFCIIGVVVYLIYTPDKYSPKIYDDSKSVEKLFIADQKTFIEIAHLLKDSDLFDYLYSTHRKSIFNTSIPRKNKYFTKQEYEFLCQFLNRYQPYEIGKRNGDLYFVFFCKKEDVVVYYTEKEDEWLLDSLIYLKQNYQVKMFKEKWFFCVGESDVVRK